MKKWEPIFALAVFSVVFGFGFYEGQHHKQKPIVKNETVYVYEKIPVFQPLPSKVTKGEKWRKSVDLLAAALPAKALGVR